MFPMLEALSKMIKPPDQLVPAVKELVLKLAE
jgi:hypothetical protein